MFVDASALVAILTDENDARHFAARLEISDVRCTSPAAIWETAINVSRILGLPVTDIEPVILQFLADMKIELVPIPPESAHLAIVAFHRFGKGRHPAHLNFGDCMAYACAKHYQLPLLFKGQDFALTDIEAA